MEYITVGEIVKAQGIRGELKVKPLTNDIARFRKLRMLYVDEKPYKVLGLRLERDSAFIMLQGVDDRTAAERLRGKFLQIDRVNAVDLADDEYFIADLLGCAVVTDAGEILGDIIDIAQNVVSDADLVCGYAQNLDVG
ncbi:MAG: ribosome maturation factor RimM, partial [Clostridiales bacterium]|nr:ribosome maturation factor RimM [Clostridiales bacterium]